MVYKYDFLVIGAGVAGMSYALKVARAKKGKICMICKTALDEANTSFAQGGVASVTNLAVDNFEKHIENQKNIYSNDCIKKISINKNEKKKLVNKLEIVGVKQNLKNKIESNRPKKKRQIDNYSYYFKIKEKSKSIKDLFQ